MASSCCRTCDHRNSAVNAFSAPRSELDVCLITLHFESDISSRVNNSKAYGALNLLLNNIIDCEESSSHPTTFTSWSPCLLDARVAVIISTARDTCSSSTSAVFDGIAEYLAVPPIVQHIYMDYSILSLAAASPGQRVACDMMQLQAPNAAVAAAMGKHFGWDPKRSSLAVHMSGCPSAAFSRPGDLVKDFWAWAELRSEDPMSPCTNASSFASSSESLARPAARLVSWNSEEKNMSLPFWGDEVQGGPARDLDDETLVMMFQWSSLEAADRFKHPLQASLGQNGEPVSKDLWERHVAHPVRQLQGLGAKIVSHKLELRAVEPRFDSVLDVPLRAGRVRSGSKRLSVIASELTEKVSGLWK